MQSEIFAKLKCLHSQDYLLRELVSRGLWKSAITCCDTTIRKRQADIEVLEKVKETINQKIKEVNNDVT